MSTPMEDLRQAIEGLPPQLAGQVLDYVEFVRTKHGVTAAANADDRAWLDTDLSRLGDLDPEDDIDPTVGQPIWWDEKRGEFMFLEA